MPESNPNPSLGCQLWSWIIAAIAGLAAFAVAIVVGGLSASAGMFIGVVLALVLGLILANLLCRPLPTLAEVQARGGVDARAPVAATAAAGGATAGMPAASGAADQKPGPDDVPAIGAAAATDERASHAIDAPADVPPIGSGAAADQRVSGATAAPAEVPPIGSGAAADQRANDAIDAPAEVPPIGASAASDERAGEQDDGAGDVPLTGADAGAGESGEGKVSATAAGSGAAMHEDFDKDGVAEGTNEGEKPPMLEGPRGGKADNLKEIKGVGPKLEKMLNGKGVYHFDQIAKWTDQELAWVDANIEGFKGRASRDEWVKQAKILASGGETEFSKRVDEGDVY